MSEWGFIELRDAIEKANTGLDAIKRAPIVEEDTGIRCLRITDVSQNNEYSKWGFTKVEDKNLKKFCLIKNDIIVARTGNTIGVNLFVNEDLNSVFNNGLIRLKVKEEYDPKFIYYLLQTCFYKRFINSIAYGTSTQPNMQIDSFLSFEIPDIPNRIQKEIAKTLSILDKKITLLRQQNHDLEELAQTLFKRWFVEFEFPNENGEPYKSSGGKMVESELGEIPEGWHLSTIGENIETIGGGTPSTTEPNFWEDGKILWYSPTDLTKEKSMYSIGSAKKITELGLQKSSAKLFPAYSLLMTSRATVGELTINTNAASTNQGFITLIPNENLSIFFLYDWLKSKLKTVHNLASGSTFPEISKTDFRNIEVLLATKAVHTGFDNIIKPIFKSIENNITEIQTLTQLRDTLLPKLMCGELRVKTE